MSDWEPKIVSFLCNWCSYGAADLAGVSRMEYPPNIRVIRIPCTGRMNLKFALAALRATLRRETGDSPAAAVDATFESFESLAKETPAAA